jgi:hypothetical protein
MDLLQEPALTAEDVTGLDAQYDIKSPPEGIQLQSVADLEMYLELLARSTGPAVADAVRREIQSGYRGRFEALSQVKESAASPAGDLEQGFVGPRGLIDEPAQFPVKLDLVLLAPGPVPDLRFNGRKAVVVGGNSAPLGQAIKPVVKILSYDPLERMHAPSSIVPGILRQSCKGSMTAEKLATGSVRTFFENNVEKSDALTPART